MEKVSDLLTEIERCDAQALTTRPQDLLDVIDFWEKNQRLGTRIELIQNSIFRRLEERKENVAAVNPISQEKARVGARIIAAAATLVKESVIKVPDGGERGVGIDAKSLLSDWTNEECKVLLSRPIFDDAIYGTVRFYHRSAREYLTAEWLDCCLKQGASRRKIENLFFKKQYGIWVIIPSMRPVLSWLVLFDGKIRKRACSIEPEVVFEGGDPSKLPLKVRRKILKDVCKKISGDTSKRSVTDYSVRRQINCYQ